MRVYRSPRSSGQCSKPVARISISRMRAFRLVGFKAFNHDARSKINRASRPRFYTRCAHQCSARARGFRISGFKAFKISGFQASRLSGFQAFRLKGFQDFRLSITMRVQRLPKPPSRSTKPIARRSVVRVHAFRLSGFQTFRLLIAICVYR
jgi:hypothetical protein